jgi:enamine deaminase RidA (YjgF/YER057c/UK114 family)
MKQARNPATVHPPVGRYVHQIEVSGEGRMLFVSGQVGRRLDGTVPEDPAEQFEVALENVVANLVAAGFEPADLVKITTYVVGAIDAAGRRAALDRLLGARVTTSTLVYVAALAAPEFKVEVEAWAAREA